MTFILPRTLDLLPCEFVVVAEGMGDATFIDKLLQFRKVENASVGCPSKESAKGMGKGAFREYFAAIQTARLRTQSKTLRGLLVVTDADGDADTSFKEVASALEDAKFPKPNRAFEVNEAAGFRVAVYLMPGECQTGTLEHILLKAAFEKSPRLETCLADFSRCIDGLKSDKPNKHVKMQMSVVAAAFCEDNPWCSSHLLWHDKNNPVPIDSRCFTHISDFLEKFAS